jgi:UDP-N-acetylglucosamine acyltransferase
VITRDALPFCLTVGNRAACYGPNKVGLQRKGFSKEVMRALDRATRALFNPAVGREQALESLASEYAGVEEVLEIVSFVKTTRRGVIPIRLGGGG